MGSLMYFRTLFDLQSVPALELLEPRVIGIDPAVVLECLADSVHLGQHPHKPGSFPAEWTPSQHQPGMGRGSVHLSFARSRSSAPSRSPPVSDTSATGLTPPASIQTA